MIVTEKPNLNPTTSDIRVGDAAAAYFDACRFPLAKRAFDLAVALPLLVLLAPVLLLVAALVRTTSRGPALFRQERIGLGERPFTMLKFRTMANGADDRVHQAFNRRELLGELDGSTPDGIYKPANDNRITPLGCVLRRYSIDELPQLINVLKGEMSLVGPRPALSWEVALFTAEERLRHRLPPGITGLWQVSGRNLLSMKQMLALDLRYCEQASLRLDLAILLRTPKAALLDRSTR
jgi:lipopolysaccharide/colanic/teichoic acid biosynthesis glycosyltransferase